jgi:hypothetical protein
MEIGATGNFPNGKLNSDDEGELAIRIASDPKKGVVMIDFGKPVKWVGLPKDQAFELAEILKKRAMEL